MDLKVSQYFYYSHPIIDCIQTFAVAIGTFKMLKACMFLSSTILYLLLLIEIWLNLVSKPLKAIDELAKTCY